jgi:Protein of unknown function (DUF1376)
MVEWYMHAIPDWMDGTEGLDDGPYRAYHVICQLIYLNNGPIALHEHGIAGRCNQHILAFRNNLKTLLDAGKLSLTDGRLSNNRAATELQRVRNKRATSAKGGRNSAGVPKATSAEPRVNLTSTPGEPRPDLSPTSGQPPSGLVEVGQRLNGGQHDNPLKNNDHPSSALFDEQHHKRREEERREEKKEDDASLGFVSLNRQTESEAAQDRQRVLSDYDFMSDDGSVLILADEFAELEREITTIKSVRAIVRNACRSWLKEIVPSERKQALLAFLRKKQRENLQRKASSSLKPDEATRAAFNEKLKERDAHAARVAAYREREAQRKTEKEANARQTESIGSGDHLGPNGCN